jgi:hypothetical protein
VHGDQPVAKSLSSTSLGRAKRVGGAVPMATFAVCTPGQDALPVVLVNGGHARIEKTHDH